MRRENGAGSIYKLSGNRRKPWVATAKANMNYTTGKVEREIIGTFETRLEAEKALHTYSPKAIEHRNLLFKTIYEKWWGEHSAKISANSVKVYKSMYSKHLSKLDKMYFLEINTLALQDFINSVNSPSSQRLVKAMLSEIYKYAQKYEIVEKDYSELIDMKKQVPIVERKNFSKEEIDTLFGCLEDRMAKAILILIYTGLRISEFLNLQEDHINNGCLKVVKSKTEAGRGRVVPIHTKIESLVQDFLSKKRKYFFTQEENKKVKYESFRKEFNFFLERLNMNHTIQDTRHTFANMLDEAKVNHTSIKEIIGHKNITTTQNTYTHKDIESLKNAINLIN